MHRLKVEKKVI